MAEDLDRYRALDEAVLRLVIRGETDEEFWREGLRLVRGALISRRLWKRHPAFLGFPEYDHWGPLGGRDRDFPVPQIALLDAFLVHSRWRTLREKIRRSFGQNGPPAGLRLRRALGYWVQDRQAAHDPIWGRVSGALRRAVRQAGEQGEITLERETTGRGRRWIRSIRLGPGPATMQPLGPWMQVPGIQRQLDLLLEPGQKAVRAARGVLIALRDLGRVEVDFRELLDCLCTRLRGRVPLIRRLSLGAGGDRGGCPIELPDDPGNRRCRSLWPTLEKVRRALAGAPSKFGSARRTRLLRVLDEVARMGRACTLEGATATGWKGRLADRLGVSRSCISGDLRALSEVATALRVDPGRGV